MEEDNEDVPSPSDLSDSSDEFTGDSDEEEDEERSAVKLRTADEDRKSQNVDALLRSV